MSQNQEIENFISQNRTTYTRQAITDTLLSKGSAKADVDAAWAVVDAQIGEVTPKARSSRPIAWMAVGSIVVLSYGVVLLLNNLSNLIGNLELRNQLSNGSIPMLAFITIQAGALVTAVIVWRRNRPVANGLVVGLLIADVVLPVAGLAILLGTCLTSEFHLYH